MFWRAEEGAQNILKPLSIQTPDHPTAMNYGYRACFLRYNHNNRVAHLRDAQGGPMAQAHLAVRGFSEHTAC